MTAKDFLKERGANHITLIHYNGGVMSLSTFMDEFHQSKVENIIEDSMLYLNEASEEWDEISDKQKKNYFNLAVSRLNKIKTP